MIIDCRVESYVYDECEELSDASKEAEFVPSPRSETEV